MLVGRQMMRESQHHCRRVSQRRRGDRDAQHCAHAPMHQGYRLHQQRQPQLSWQFPQRRRCGHLRATGTCHSSQPRCRCRGSTAGPHARSGTCCPSRSGCQSGTARTYLPRVGGPCQRECAVVRCTAHRSEYQPRVRSAGLGARKRSCPRACTVCHGSSGRSCLQSQGGRMPHAARK